MVENPTVLIIADDNAQQAQLHQLVLSLGRSVRRLMTFEPDEALAHLAQNTVHAVVIANNPLHPEWMTFIQQCHQHFAATPLIIVTEESPVSIARQTGVLHVIPECDSDDLLSTLYYAIRSGERFGLAHYLAETTPVNDVLIQTSNDIMPVFLRLRSFLVDYAIACADDLASALIEAITNAVYHAMRHPDGSHKYIKGQYIEMLPLNETVLVRYGADAQCLGVSIQDQGGQLTPEDILYGIDRHMTDSGLMDTHGRGLYLIHTLADRMIVNIQPQQKTELIILQNRRVRQSKLKVGDGAIHINVTSALENV